MFNLDITKNTKTFMEVTKDTIYVGHMSHGQRIAPNPKDAHPLKSGD